MATIVKRENKKGTTYKVVIRKKGYNTVTQTFEKKSEAQAWAKNIETQMDKGIYKETHVIYFDDNKTLIYIKDLIDYFKKNEAPERYADAEKYYTMFDWWADKIGNIKIKELASHNLSYCKQLLLTEKIHKKDGLVVRANNTINKYLMCMSAILTYAVDELELLDVNPMKKVKCVSKPNGRTRFLSLEEISSLLSACKKHSDRLYIFVLLSMATGARYSEVRTLRVINIDFENNQVFFLDTKNKEHRGVPIDADILEVVKIYIQNNDIDDYIFTNKNSNKLYYIRGPLMNIIKDIGLEDFHIHDIRHTTASYIAMNGGSLLDIAEILGHKSLTMARRYSHLTQKHTATVLKKVTNKIIPNV